jgi:hypothetical protein
MLVDERHHYFGRRSSSAWAKYADALRRISLARFSSRNNLGEIKSLGIRDVVLSKAPGLAIKEMIKRTWLYQKLRHFRAGIEGVISFLKRSFGWDRCAWRSYRLARSSDRAPTV